MENSSSIEQAYRLASERYSALGVDTDSAMERLAEIAISLQCWQGDDVAGFEEPCHPLGNGLAVTGKFPGRARSPDELRSDLDKAISLIPGRHRVNLHANYAETTRPVERNAIEPSHFKGWIEWAHERRLGLDFNPTYYAHLKADDCFTLSHADRAMREFWIEHGIRSRRIGAAMGQALGTPCVTNVWIPDGYKDTPADRLAPRERLLESLDAIFAEPLDPRHNLDSVECKLFGIGSESYVVGSHEFYLGYAISRKKLLCLDAGHFHPTETISDKISSVLLYLDRILLHVSRGVRWDSDHVVTLSDEVRAIALEIVRGRFLNRVHIGLDFFDASINRVAAWVIGTRSMIKALLLALLEPSDLLRKQEVDGDFTYRLAMMEELKTYPIGAVWDFYCQRHDVPTGGSWLKDIKRHEQTTLSKRD